MAAKKSIALFDIDYTLFDTDHFKQTNLMKYNLYEETAKVLEELKGKIELGIFSQGTKDLQERKLKETRIESFFHVDHVHIVENKEEELQTILNKYKNYFIFLIDDNLPHLQRASKIHSDLVTIWVKRGKYAKVQEPIEGFEPSVIIFNLEEVIPIVLGNKTVQ